VQEWMRREADELLPKLVEWRRDFHRHPELGFQEVRTAGIVAAHLQELGLEVSTGVGKTGVIAMVEPDDLPDDCETVLLRFDMDALPIHEETGLPYASQNAGVMHACGHDGHTAIGMGVAQLLTRHRNELPGRVKLVFQPAEEGLGGAMAMISDGALEEPQPAAAYGLHLWSRLPYNQVVVQPGPLWAAADMFTLTVHGKGGHGATPHDTVDATLVASQLVVALQTIVSRNANPSDTVVVTVASFQSGNAGNVISERAVLEGTISSIVTEVRELLLRRFEEICTGVCQAFGASYEFEMHSCVPATINSEAGARVMEGIAREVVGEQNVAQIAPMMVGEDMAEFLNRAPGCFVLVGAANPEEGFYSPHHSPSFDFEESVMPTGVSLLAQAAFSQLAVPSRAENVSET